jgi:hypothetical protein
MSDVNLQLVREFFEFNLFSVLTNWQQAAWRPQEAEQSAQFFVENMELPAGTEPGFLLAPENLPALERAVVEVRAWHADRFYPSVIESNPILAQFVEHRDLADQIFGGLPYATILVLSELPASPEPRTRAIQLLQERGIDHVIEFPTVLQDLLNRLDMHGNYASSQTLQTLRLMKRYRLVRNQQMEFTFPLETRGMLATGATVQTAPPEEDDA